MQYHDSVILVYAKAPIERKVNSRLIPDIGVQAATKLQHDLIHDRLSMLSAANLCDVRLMCALDSRHECFLQCAKQYPVTLFEQAGNDLGERIFNGLSQALEIYDYCIVIGTDAPSLDSEIIRQVIQKLHSGSEVVVVPAEDGGYVLIAMREAHVFLFHDINWGSAEVMQQTADKLRKKNLSFEVLASCWDVDRPDDYQRYLNLLREKRSN
jgi:uncharacterized protein